MCYTQESEVWTQLEQAQPEIMVVNQGMHWLHFLGQGRDNVPGCVIKRWIAFVQWLDEVVLFAEKIGVKILLFKTNNRICADKFRGPYKAANTLYSANDTDALKKCSKIVQSLIPGGGEVANKQDLDNYCQHGAFNNTGSLHMNARLKKCAEGWQQQNENALIYLGIFNDYDVQSCSYTEVKDGRHYHPLNLVRIRLLANTLQCLVQNTSSSTS